MALAALTRLGLGGASLTYGLISDKSAALATPLDLGIEITVFNPAIAVTIFNPAIEVTIFNPDIEVTT